MEKYVTKSGVEVTLPEKISSESYSRLAVRTESPTTPAMVERIAMVVPRLRDLIEQQIRLGHSLDVLKKFIFYGKGDAEIIPGIQFDAQTYSRLADNQVIRLLHAAIGLATETGEVFEPLYGHIFNGITLDGVNVAEEFVDANWYIGIGFDACNTNLQNCLETNILKLAVRFPSKFTEDAANERNLDAERQILEDGFGGLKNGDTVLHSKNGLGTVTEVAEDHIKVFFLFNQVLSMVDRSEVTYVSAEQLKSVYDNLQGQVDRDKHERQIADRAFGIQGPTGYSGHQGTPRVGHQGSLAGHQGTARPSSRAVYRTETRTVEDSPIICGSIIIPQSHQETQNVLVGYEEEKFTGMGGQFDGGGASESYSNNTVNTECNTTTETPSVDTCSVDTSSCGE